MKIILENNIWALLFTICAQCTRSEFILSKNLHLCIQRGLQRFFKQFLMVYSRFCSFSFTLRHSLKTVFPRVPHLSVAVYVVRRIDAPEEAPYKHNETLCNPLDFHLCISPF